MSLENRRMNVLWTALMGMGSRLAVCGLMVSCAVAVPVAADPLSIHTIQSNTTNGDVSVYDNHVVDCAGGIVVAEFPGYRPRVMLQDPAHPDGWGAIQIKDWIYDSGAQEWELYDNVRLGDWVELTNVLAEEFRGGTFLQYQSAYNPGFRIVSRDNPLPTPILVDVAETPAPIEYLYGEWYVNNHDAEPYEAMRIIVRDVTVTAVNLGKAVDNYNLQTPAGDDCWAADYMNESVQSSGYHKFVRMDRHFCAVSGMFEQYTRMIDGWDYYQLVTLDTASLAICGDGDNDGDVELDDMPRFHECFAGPVCNGVSGGCDPPAWTTSPMPLPILDCLMMDMDYDGDVDLRDFAGLQRVFGMP